MNSTTASRMSVQLFRSAARKAAVSLGRRGYAEVSGKLNLSLTLPHQVGLNPQYDREF